MAEQEARRKLLPFLPGLPGLGVLNPLGLLRPARNLLRPRAADPRRNKQSFACASVALGESVASASSMATAGSYTPPAAALPASKVPLKPASDVVVGALARAASQSTIHPLDTLKVRLQTSGSSKANVGALSKFGKLVPPPAAGGLAAPGGMTVQQMGQFVGGLYRGVLGAASGAGIAIGAYFAFYGAACNVISTHTDMAPGAIAFVSGGIAAVGSSFVKVPLAVCIRSVQAGVYPNFFAAAASITKAAGVRGLFTGYTPTVMEDVPDMAIKFAVYESLRSLHRRLHEGHKPSRREDFAYGALSGAVAAAATTPLDVIKTNMMCAAAQRPSMLSAATLVYSQGGLTAFFRGVGTRAMSNGINSAVFFCFFEALKGTVEEAKRKRAQEQREEAGAPAGRLMVLPVRRLQAA